MPVHRRWLPHELERRLGLDVIDRKMLGLSWGAFCDSQMMRRARTVEIHGPGIGFKKDDFLGNRPFFIPSSGSSFL